MNRRQTLALLAALLPARAFAQTWDLLDRARGQEVFFHAWGGDPKINDFIAWLGEEAAALGITLTHVKLAATADAVARVRAEKAAGATKGAVDLIWINGENFAAMKAEGLLFGPFAESLPNWPLVDTRGKPATVTDFTLPTEGYESPWAMAQLVFEHDSAQTEAPRSILALADWAKANPGRFTYPQPPDYLGLTFLKQVLYALLPDPAILQSPWVEGAEAPLWPFLDALHPHLWRQGRAFPRDEPALGQLLAEGETLISFAFNPGRASAEIAAGRLAETVRTFVLEGGTIGNASFVAIPFNASAPEGAQVVANLILSPKVQARAQDATVLGFQTVLDVASLPEADRALFEALPLGPATLSPADLGPVLLEPHASWMAAVSGAWTRRYGAG
ncbi:ABC transporter substrate-binding protein [Stagnihabitans tardus]|uniref:ABC transporter substrate-binding protein n=1 Tax=Stagnihabitans tardus TaxID=2699202 RepID=A0AAE4YFM5_9RHOB|nr:ABC transporter substrate-binding protein [Stagnihabitans tardus]NBZ88770.1 ABC transporter substrate-binding protein [Stagnihabitans tardus]